MKKLAVSIADYYKMMYNADENLQKGWFLQKIQRVTELIIKEDLLWEDSFY